MERGKREYAVGFHLNNDFKGGEFIVIEDEKEKIIGKVLVHHIYLHQMLLTKSTEYNQE